MAKKSTEEPGTDVAEYTGYDISAYAPIAVGIEKIQEIMEANLGEEGLTVDDLVQVKMPSGGMMMFQVGDDGVKEIEGIIVHVGEGRSYWEHEMDDAEGEAGGPPDCSSVDRKTGDGPLVENKVLDGDCVTCPFNRYGTRGRGKACKEFNEIFITPPEELFPMRLRVSPTSLKKVKAFMTRLTSRMLLKQHVVVVLGLEKATNRDNIEYGLLTIRAAEMDGLAPVAIRGDQRPQLDEYVTAIQPSLIRLAWVPRDDDGPDGEPDDEPTDEG